ncbi:hypothetical protein A2757_00330 [Candidatus Giovannonibacteria bacterium RIFCSPHIGHO2_01_FULL_48_47]|nr:MAG: hypothetical protein A2757_00330 [Candidatus Giovannonibacteria bacterium RIFCSPHIGHO2_01_FULL_48_47]OGF68738.1 MAG: hypothetical protein A3D61_01450 [Candidatus Giovannonibacteria bacterium RIFCSPHIGHO2_02_FULL_48_15]OGF89653.1 MAG: hypothetical protein A3B26_02870 [Candidatus Giovannonibacteria bacterium RIFCSPLOWO2_01_FULL_48_47]OGF95388.1 MAG: hypothetical protein A2433_02880 [Candidatus Giovannonibacteria bacterium RIFOXYC1_FULL_48_8]OGF96329.1 MAG: hypothetical protein A2613_02090
MAEAAAIENAEQMEAERSMKLQESRLRARISRSAKAQVAAGVKIGLAAAFLMLGFAGMLDLVDWLGVGSIPLIGDILDIFGGLVIYFWVKIKGLDQKKPWYISWLAGGGTLVELIPGGDILPSYILTVLVIIIVNTSWGQRWAKFLSPI